MKSHRDLKSEEMCLLEKGLLVKPCRILNSRSYRSLFFCISVFVSIVAFPQRGISQTFTLGDKVVLDGGTSRGIPLHSQPRSSRFGYAEIGTEAEVIDLHNGGRWLFLKLETARAWVLARNTMAAEAEIVTAIDSVDRAKLLELDCPGGQRQVLKNSLFSICHDTDWRIPLWVGYPVFGDNLSGPGDRHRSSWQPDERVTLSGQANNPIYVGSGFHKGHLAPAQTYVRSQAAVDGTHIYTNAVPQFGSVNSGAWAQLEKAVRNSAVAGADLWVITGSLFVSIDPRCQENRPPERCLLVDTSLEPHAPENRMRDEIAVPSHTFKAVLSEFDGEWSARAFIMPNIPRGAGKFRNYRFSVDELERMLGLDLFGSLPDEIEQRIEERASTLAN